jgi:hypothetical protein
MSKTESAASEQEQEGLESDSVFDFLYHDVRRVGSFLAQFDDAGHLQQVTQSDGATRGSKRGWKAAAGGSLPGVGSANVSVERAPEKGGFEASERVYDPLWTNARTLLDFLSERDMLKRTLVNASIGQFVLVSGSLLILDLPMLKNAWASPVIQKLMRDGVAEQSAPAGNRQQRRAQGATASITTKTSQIELVVAILSMMPHVLQCRLLSQDVNVWCTLNEEFIVGKASDLTLKHGTLLQGEWQMLGILDAYPDDASRTNADLQAVISAIAATPVGQLSTQFAPVAQTMLGRPGEAHGVTPLLIFRDVTG